VIQLQILSGRQAGATWVARRFPVRIGRAPGCDLRLEDGGVFDQHLLLGFKPVEGCVLDVHGEALVMVNGQPVQHALLHNGDAIQFGSVALRFWLAPATQGGLALREVLTWVAIGAVCLGQLALLYGLLR
jgi:pSer/pThr/pTyr-binding forkhead associated (FHA) protein